jgi:GGDEF domain-containing protein
LEAKYSFPREKIELYVDKDRMIQVFMNLLSNSVKFTPAGHIEISVIDRETVVECSVSDTGIGISDEDLPRIFSKFEQFGREFESAEKGTGLGLAISKGTIELHGGKIWAESNLGQGTKISFTLPKYDSLELFKEYVTNGVAKAIKEGASLSIVILDVKYSDALQERLGRDKTASIMRSLGQLIKTELRRKSDISIKDSRAILVVLPETDKRCAWSTADRLKLSSDDYLSKEGLDKEIGVELRVASFPEDGPSEEELLNEVGL